MKTQKEIKFKRFHADDFFDVVIECQRHVFQNDFRTAELMIIIDEIASMVCDQIIDTKIDLDPLS